MKIFKSAALAFAAVLGIASTVLTSSCNEDGCKFLNCRNGGSCDDGYCRCPTGFEGSECDFRIADKFLGRYIGYTNCQMLPDLVDTIEIKLVAAPDTVSILRRATPGDVLFGNAVGDKIVVPTISTGKGTRTVYLKLDGQKLTFFDERDNDTTDNTPSVICTSFGTKQ